MAVACRLMAVDCLLKAYEEWRAPSLLVGSRGCAVATGFITHKSKRIYFIDAEGIDRDRVGELAAKAAAEIRAEPPASVLTITHVKNARVDMQVVDTLRKLAEGNAPYVKAACVTGLSQPQKIVFYTVKILSRRDLRIVDSVEEAKEYLAGLP
jgi:hypothetical protein